MSIHSADGMYQPLGATSRHDLIPPPPPKQYVWINVYKEDDGVLKSRQMTYPSKDSADKMAVSGRVGCMKVTLEERWDG